MMRKSMIALSLAVLAVAGICVGGCETKSDDKHHAYPGEDDDRARPNSPIPQMGTDGFVDDD